MSSRKRSKDETAEDSSESDSGSSSSGSDGSDNDRRKKRRHKDSKKKKDNHKKSRGSSSESSSSDSDSDHKRDSRKRKKSKKHKSKSKSKKHKKEKKKKKKSKHSSSKKPEFGKYGILGDADRYKKQQEFYLWLRDIKNIEPENQPPHMLNEFFRDYAEDYNTVTLPHKKFYDLEAYEAKVAQKRAKLQINEPIEDTGAFSILDDENNKRKQHAARNKLGMSRAELAEMAQIMRERAQAPMKKDLGMKVDDKAGMRTKSVLRGSTGPSAKPL
eukprot:m.18952 g.18952  ORF g.18952 m.18952 type:complete len:272 (+) comp6458_c0_seq1:158-973(+)